MLTEKLNGKSIDEILLPAGDVYPLPKAADRQGWDIVTAETKQTWITEAEKYLRFTWPALTASKYLHFSRTGENTPYLFDFWERRSILGILLIAECMEAEGRFIDQIINGVYCVCEETSWMTAFDVVSIKKSPVPAREDVMVDLSCSETGALLAWVYYLLQDRLDEISPRIGERIKHEIQIRLIEPYLNRDDFWWMGFVPTPRINNWNPWCNKNMLVCLLLTEPDADKRGKGVEKAIRSLERYIEEYPADGCCDEGPMYWGAAGGGLNTCLELLHMATSGTVDVFSEEIIKDIGRYICKVFIHGDYFVDFADGDAKVKVSGSVYSYGKNIGDENLTSLGAWGINTKPVIKSWFDVYGAARNILQEKEKRKKRLSPPYIRDAWMDVSQVMAARENEGSSAGLYLAAKAGYNAESHNHNDIGNFIVYANGKPVLIDLGTEEYTAKTFSPQRFELWYLQSQYHNCPTINGVMQHDGKEYKANDVKYIQDGDYTGMEADISGAYPAEAGAVYWRRTCGLFRHDPRVEVADKFLLKEPSSRIRYHFISAAEPEILPDGTLALRYNTDESVLFIFDTSCLTAEIETITVSESRLRENWGETLYRINISEREAVKEGERHFIFKNIRGY